MQAPAKIVLDPYRAFVFPNRIREQRRFRGLQKLMALSEHLPEIPYIRLSKIERGEVFARADELRRIARAMDLPPGDLLTDVTDPRFDIATWAQPFRDGRPILEEEEQFSVLLAAALRVLRNGDAELTIATLDKDYALPPVILSRLENAYKTLDRWNDTTLAAVCKLFGVSNVSELRATVKDRYREGVFNKIVGNIVDPQARAQRSRERIAALSEELKSEPVARRVRGTSARSDRVDPQPQPVSPTLISTSTTEPVALRRDIPVFGTPLAGGLIAFTPTDARVEAPRKAGPSAFALRVCRATLGPGLPSGGIVIADPDRLPFAGGLAVVRSAEGYRIVSVTFDRSGATKGYSVTPDVELDLDQLDPADVIAVVAVVFV